MQVSAFLFFISFLLLLYFYFIITKHPKAHMEYAAITPTIKLIISNFIALFLCCSFLSKLVTEHMKKYTSHTKKIEINTFLFKAEKKHI